MALAAISSISSGGLARLYRSPLAGSLAAADRGGAVSRVEAVPALAGREDARPEDAADGPSQEKKAADARGLGVDPRRPESILLARGAQDAAARKAEEARIGIAGARSEEGRRERQSRLDELLGEKSAMERKQAEQKGQRSAEVVSQLSQLKSRDAEVRAHEAAHMAAGGRYVTGGATYTYQSGPDGGQYAVGGEVGIDTSAVPGKPEETVQKMRTVRAAALAPSEPSSADISVAAAAAQIEASALAQIAQARAEEAAGRYGAEASRGTDAGRGQGLGRDEGRPDSLDLVA